MKRLVAVTSLVSLAFIGIIGCATVSSSSPNYVEVGMTVAALKGHRFFFATGTVNVYGFLGLVALRSQEYGVAIMTEPDSGKVIRIATMQPAGRATTQVNGPEGSYYVYGAERYRLGDLVGGISVDDIHATDSWASAVEQAARFDQLNRI